MMEVLIGLPGFKAISSSGQRVTAVNQVIFYFPGGTKGARLCTGVRVQMEIKKNIKNELMRHFNSSFSLT